jgi:hypothetical protein
MTFPLVACFGVHTKETFERNETVLFDSIMRKFDNEKCDKKGK